MATDAEKQEIAAEVAAEEGADQLSTGHPTQPDDAVRGNVHSEEQADDQPGAAPAPHGH